MSFRKWSEAQNDSIKVDTNDKTASPSAGDASADDKQAAQPTKQPATDDKP